MDVKQDMIDDSELLSKIGYEQKLHRGMNGFMSFTIGFTEVSAVVSVTSIFSYGLSTGGPVTMIWGWVITFFMTMSIALNFAEICSVFPCAGSVYHWAGVLAPRDYARSAAYWTGLFNWMGNTAGDSSFAFIFAQFVSAAIVAGGFDPLPNTQLVGLAISVLLVWSIINCFHIHSVCWINNFAALIQAATIVALVVVVLHFSTINNSSSFVLREFNNDTGFDQEYYVVVLSILFPLFGFAGYDAAGHLAEETKGSSIAAPMGIISTVVATGLFGFILIIILLVTVKDIDDAIGGLTGNAAIQIVSQNCGDYIASVFAWLLVVNIFFCGSSSVTVTSRIWFALCRDKATIFSETLSAVNPFFRSPINGIIFMFFIQSILLLLPLNSDKGVEAFISIIGITVVGLQISYGIPILLKILSFISPPQHAYVAEKLKRSHVYLGIFSLPLGILACVWLFFTTLILLLPTSYPVNSSSINYTVVAVAFVVVFGILNWELNSKHTFRGPPRDDDEKENDDGIPGIAVCGN